MAEEPQEPQVDEAPVQAPPPLPEGVMDLQLVLVPPLDAEQAQELATRISIDYHAGLQDRAEWETRYAEGEDAYYGIVPNKTQPWVGCSNFHVPITQMDLETLKPRLVKAVLGQTPPIVLTPTSSARDKRAGIVESFLNWQVTTQMDLEPVVEQSAHLFLQPGVAIAKTTWQVTRIRRKYVREFGATTPLPTVFEALFGPEQPRELTEVAPNEWTAQLPGPQRGGGACEVKVRFNLLPADASASLEETLQVLVTRDEVTEQPHVEMVDPLDLIAPAKGGHTIAELPWVQHRMWMDEFQLRAAARTGRFNAAAVERLLQDGAPRGDQPFTDSQNVRAQRDAVEGIEGDGPSNVRKSQWAIIEDYRRYDIDDDGDAEEIITWVAVEDTKEVLGWDYLDNVYAHGRRPLRVGRYRRIPFRFYGVSLPEAVRGIQDEINTMHNQRVDYATITNMPWGFYRADASVPPITAALRPGGFYPLQNPQTDVNIPKFASNPAWGQSEEALLMQYNERVAQITDLSLGRQPNRVGATRTAAGTQTLIGEGSIGQETVINEFQRFWAGVFEDILALDQEYLPPATEFRVTGQAPPTIKIADRSEIRGRYDLRLATSTEMLNRQRYREDAQVVLQALSNPMAIQSGISGLKGVKRAYEDFLRAYGKDPELYLEDKAPVLTPEEELALFNAGEDVHPVMGEDVQHHLQTHMMQAQLGLLRPEGRAKLMAHIQETVQIAQMQMAAQQQGARPGGGQGAPPVGQQATNAQQGRAPQPSPTTTPMNGGGPGA